MIEAMIMIAIMALLGATKKAKMPVFGQMTLTGEKALDWMKNETAITTRKIEMGAAALFGDWNMPDWAKEKGIVALLYPIDEWANPVLVTQKSILRVLEAKCAEWEAAGAAVTVMKVQLGQIAVIEFEENHPRMEFLRPADGPTYAPYRVVFE